MYFQKKKGSNRDGKFAIDKQTGELSVVKPEKLLTTEYRLCAFVRFVKRYLLKLTKKKKNRPI